MGRGKPIRYSPAELAWIKDNAQRPRRDTFAEFRQRFAREDLTDIRTFNALCKRKGWMTGRTGRYEKGRTPENKGKTMPYNANSARTQFKKGHRNARARDLYKPIGTERLNDGYVERKVNDDLPMHRRWRMVHILNWEALNGKVPEGHVLKCLDGDRQNTDPANWEPIPKGAMPFLNGHRGFDYQASPPEIRPAVLALAKLNHAAGASLRRARTRRAKTL